MTNKDTPVHPFSFEDKFQQKVIFGGITKQEWVALELFVTQWKECDSEESFKFLVGKCYEDAAQFLSHLENRING
jgi:hypothetical protein